MEAGELSEDRLILIRAPRKQRRLRDLALENQRYHRSAWLPRGKVVTPAATSAAGACA